MLTDKQEITKIFMLHSYMSLNVVGEHHEKNNSAGQDNTLMISCFLYHIKTDYLTWLLRKSYLVVLGKAK